MKIAASNLAAALLLASSTVALADTKMDVIKGTSEGIVLIGPKRSAPEAASPATTAPGGTVTAAPGAVAPASGAGWGAPRAVAATTSTPTAAPATSVPLLDRLRGLNLGAPPSGQTMSSIKKAAGSDSVGIPLPTGTAAGGEVIVQPRK